MTILDNAKSFDHSLDGLTTDHGGILRCETCKLTRPVQSRYWREGWPKHCGYTMRWWTQRQIDAGEMPNPEAH